MGKMSLVSWDIKISENMRNISCCTRKDRTVVQIRNVETERIMDGRVKGNIHPKHTEPCNYHVNN
jgi:hypothetical protein